MAIKYYVGIVLKVCGSRIKVLRKTRTYQLSCEGATNFAPGDWIIFSFDGDSEVPVIEPVSPVLPTKIVKVCESDGSASYQIFVQTVAAVPGQDGLKHVMEHSAWSPHFEWIVDEYGIFDHEEVEPNVLYVTWIKLLNEPCASNKAVLTEVAEIVRPAEDQLPVYDAPWMVSELSADAELLSVHGLLNRPKSKINQATSYTGLVLWSDTAKRRKQVALWSAATGIVFFRHPRCAIIRIGSWLDFLVRVGRDDVLEARNLKYSRNRKVPTRAVRGKAQVCDKMKIPRNMPEYDWIWVSDIVGKVYVDLRQFKKSVANNWPELAGNTKLVWLSWDQLSSTVYWKFDCFATFDEYAENGDEDVERFADMVML